MFYRKAVLIIHGFVGCLYDNEYLMNYLELDNKFDVFARTLPGHYENEMYQKAADNGDADAISMLELFR